MKRSPVYLMLFTMLLMPFLPGAIQATGCRVVAVKKAVVVQEKVVVAAAALVVPVVAQYVAPVYAAPLYGATYAPQAQGHCPPQTQTESDLAAAVKALAEQVRALSERVGAPQMPPADPPEKPGKPTNPFAPVTEQRLLTLTTKHCASCHNSSVSASRGGKLTLLEGGRVSNLTPESLGKIIEAVSTKTMPKAGNMTDQERLEFLALLVGGKP